MELIALLLNYSLVFLLVAYLYLIIQGSCFAIQEVLFRYSLVFWYVLPSIFFKGSFQAIYHSGLSDSMCVIKVVFIFNWIQLYLMLYVPDEDLCFTFCDYKYGELEICSLWLKSLFSGTGFITSYGLRGNFGSWD